VKSLVELLVTLLQDCGRVGGAPVWRDVKTLLQRVGHEGESFITLTLASFCEDFENCLREGRVVPGSFRSFKKTGKAGIPAFLQGFLYQVFNTDGRLLDEPSVDCIRVVRQICLFGKKVKRPCTRARVLTATERYIRCDSDVTDHLPSELSSLFFEIGAILCEDAQILGPEWRESILPRHGPGATRERISGNQKWLFKRWHQRLDAAGIDYWTFGKGSRFFPFAGTACHGTELWPVIVGPEDEEPVRVVFVPKTLKSPRVIAVEPVCMQFAQQGLGRFLMRRISRSSLMGGHVEFRDQTINQDLARAASAHGMLATLDMSDASDRVGLVHVRAMLATAPSFLRAVLAARSTRAQLPSGEVIHLKKFASMGSALCFPIEAMVFFTSILTSMCYRLGYRPSRRILRTLGEDVSVYGDDLVVPSDMAPSICEDLELLGFKVNQRKSFGTGKFRESCGADCYAGVEVTPVYFRHDMPADRKDVHGLLASVSTSNQLYKAGYWRTAYAIRTAVEALLGPLPQVTADSPALGWEYHSEYVPPCRRNEHLQRTEYQYLSAAPVRRADSLDGSEQALAKAWRLIGIPDLDPRHLERSSTPYAVTLKRRWGPTL